MADYQVKQTNASLLRAVLEEAHEQVDHRLMADQAKAP